MELLGIIVFEYILGYALQAFAYLLGVHAFMRRKLVVKEYIIVGSIFTVGSILMRHLPISFGVHTILNIVLLFIISITLLKMPVYTSARSILFVTVLLLIAEIASVLIMRGILGQETFSHHMSIRLDKAVMGIPATFAFTIFTVIAYRLLTKAKGYTSQGDDFGNISS